LAFVSGAVSGVGIWFSIGLVAPEATTFLIRLFLWVWAIEWVFFALELASGYVYYLTWDRLKPAWHTAVGGLYAVTAFMSLVMINGILTFMLTPGLWLDTGGLWDAWWNPSFLPSLCMRTVSSLALAGIFVAIVATMKRGRFERSQREHIIAWGARFLLPLALMPVLAVWYFSSLPESARSLVLGGAVAITFFFLFGVLMSFLIAMYALFGMLRRARDVNLETALLMAAIAFIATGSMEFVREGMRKPYVLHDVMYSNGIMVKDVPMLNRDGVLAHARWVQPDSTRFPGELAVGEAVYRIECLRCHEIEGYNAIRPLIKDWNHPLIMSALDHLDKIKRFMPPFVGTQAEKEALAKYLLSLTGRGSAAGATTDSTAVVPASVDSLPLEEGSAP
jgi:cytochrome bd-type quinol oxidase subunit 1